MGGSPTGSDKIQECLSVQTQYKGGPEDNAGATSQRPCRNRSVPPQTQGNAGASGRSRAVSAQPLGPRNAGATGLWPCSHRSVVGTTQRGRDRPMAVQSPLSRGGVCWNPCYPSADPKISLMISKTYVYSPSWQKEFSARLAPVHASGNVLELLEVDIRYFTSKAAFPSSAHCVWRGLYDMN